jgi:hypothetical protein
VSDVGDVDLSGISSLGGVPGVKQAEAAPAIGGVIKGAIGGAATGAAVGAGVVYGIEGVAIGVTVAAAAAGDAATSLAAVGVAAGAADALSAIGIGVAAGNAIPIPGIGAAIGAIIGALVALAEIINSFGQTYAILAADPSQAQPFLAAIRVDPQYLFQLYDQLVRMPINPLDPGTYVAGTQYVDDSGYIWTENDAAQWEKTGTSTPGSLQTIGPEQGFEIAGGGTGKGRYLASQPGFWDPPQDDYGLSAEQLLAKRGIEFHNMAALVRELRILTGEVQVHSVPPNYQVVASVPPLKPNQNFLGMPMYINSDADLPFVNYVNGATCLVAGQDSPVTCPTHGGADYDEPLTSPLNIANEYINWIHRQQSAPDLRTQAQAESALKVLRANLATGLSTTNIEGDTVPVVFDDEFRHEVALTRGLAGETGPDQALAVLLGGDVTAIPPPPMTVIPATDAVSTKTATFKAAQASQAAQAAQDAPVGQKATAAANAAVAAMTPNVSAMNPLWFLGGAFALSGVALFALSTLAKDDRLKALPKGGSFATGPMDTFSRVLSEGVSEDDIPAVEPRKKEWFDKAVDPRLENLVRVFEDAWARGVSATDLASSGKYFSAKPMPIRIEVYSNGSMKLTEGQHLYTAARGHRAKAILAHVVQYSGGRPIASHVAPVRLL